MAAFITIKTSYHTMEMVHKFVFALLYLSPFPILIALSESYLIKFSEKKIIVYRGLTAIFFYKKIFPKDDVLSIEIEKKRVVKYMVIKMKNEKIKKIPVHNIGNFNKFELYLEKWKISN